MKNKKTIISVILTAIFISFTGSANAVYTLYCYHEYEGQTKKLNLKAANSLVSACNLVRNHIAYSEYRYNSCKDKNHTYCTSVAKGLDNESDQLASLFSR